jgi:hypothetical protein
MSEILANIVVEQNNINFQPENNNLNVTPEAFNLNIYAGATSIAVPGGANTNIQFNDANIFGGSSALTFNKTTNVTSISNLVSTFANLGSVSNVKISGGSNDYIIKTDGNGNLSFSNTALNANYANFAGNIINNSQPNITSLGNLSALNVNGVSNLGIISNVVITGGTNGYVLQTDGVGNLTWVAQGGSGNGNPGGSNTQIQYNDAGLFGGTTNFTFDKVSGNVNIPGSLNVTSNGVFGNITSTNITSNGGIFTGNAAGLTNIPGANVTGSVANATFANTANNSTYATNVTGATQSNITALGNLINLTVLGTTSIFETIENVALIGAQSGNYNYNILDGAIQYSTSNASANVGLNFRGNSTVTVANTIANGKSFTATYLLTNGTNSYAVSNVSIDGTASTIKWVGGVAPTKYSNAIQSYTFTVIKTSTTPTYTVLGSMTRYA